MSQSVDMYRELKLIPDWIVGVVEDVEPSISEGAILSFPFFLQEPLSSRRSIDGPTMRVRAVEMGANKGLSDVPALLGKDGKGLATIPVELRDGGISIVLTATVLRSRNGAWHLPFLWWDGDAWVVSFSQIVVDWPGNIRLVSCK